MNIHRFIILIKVAVVWYYLNYFIKPMLIIFIRMDLIIKDWMVFLTYTNIYWQGITTVDTIDRFTIKKLFGTTSRYILIKKKNYSVPVFFSVLTLCWH